MAREKRRDPRHGRYDDLEQQLGEHVRDLVVEKLAAKAAKRDRRTAKGRMQVEAIELLTERISAVDFWTRVPPGERRTRITREELAAAAVRIADTEGFDALSMRRLAAEVGVGTMTLYHYVENKDELLTLLFDAVMGEVVVPEGDPLPVEWRAALVAIASRTRAVLTRHPWMFDIADDPPIGPNSVRHFDQTLQAVSGLPLPLAEKLHIVHLIDEFLFGFSLNERNNGRGNHGGREMLDYVAVLLETEAYPALGALVAEDGLDAVWEEVQRANDAPDRFEKHLGLLLDGVESGLARHST